MLIDFLIESGDKSNNKIYFKVFNHPNRHNMELNISLLVISNTTKLSKEKKYL